MDGSNVWAVSLEKGTMANPLKMKQGTRNIGNTGSEKRVITDGPTAECEESTTGAITEMVRD